MKRYCRTCGKVEEDDLRVLCSACGGMLIPGKEFVFRGCKGEIPLTYVEVKETESRIELTETELQIAQTVTWFDAVKRPSVSWLTSSSVSALQKRSTRYSLGSKSTMTPPKSKMIFLYIPVSSNLVCILGVIPGLV